MRTTRLHACVLGLLVSTAAVAQSTTRVSGFFGQSSGPNEYLQVGFTCSGAPTCTGQYNLEERAPNCSNTFIEADTFAMTGLNLAQSGPIQGTMTLGKAENTYTRLSDGTCVIAPGATDATVPYSGTWNLATRTATITVFGGDHNFAGGFTAENTAPPVFEMTVSSSITPQSATASANIRFRTQDVGQSGGVFAFAAAPAPLVQGLLATKAVDLGKARSSTKADPPACVLAQLNSQGQLVAVSAAQLQSFVTGAFSAQGTSVQILNGIPTPRVAGATFYVGYGSNGGAMLDSGVFRNAVLIPGNSTCPPLPYMTSLWWNPDESGWGLNLNQQGSTMFGTLFTYDANRTPLWLVMPAGTLSADGQAFSGALYRTTGPAFNANPFTPIGAANITQVGTMTVFFSHANAGSLSYTVNGVSVQKSIQRQVYGSRASNCMPSVEARGGATNYQDLWWNAAESGWGVNVTHQDNTLFATLFTYDPSGRDLWLVLPWASRQADGSYLGDLFRTTGSPFNTQPFPPIGASDISGVGNMRFRFTNGNTGTLTYTYNGTTVTKAITRQEFSTPFSACN